MNDADVRTTFSLLHVAAAQGGRQISLEELVTERSALAVLDEAQSAQMVIDLREHRDGMAHEIISSDHAVISVQHLESGHCWLSVRAGAPETYPLIISLDPAEIELVARALGA